MEKLMITGEEDRFSRNVKTELANEYELCECEFGSQPLRRAIRMQRPRAMVCFKSMQASVMLFTETRELFPEVGIVAICEEDDTSLAKFAGEGLVVLERPVKISELRWALQLAIQQTEVEEPLKCILAVDDNAMVLRSIKEMLEDEYEVAFATSGRKALDMLEKRTYDLILLDYEMPTMNGYQVMKELKSNSGYGDIPIVFLTGVADKRRIMEVVDLHPEGYLLKPIDVDFLHKTLKEILGD